jgi:ubiquinol-cytochrome c reductase iron-sulfur subunit
MSVDTNRRSFVGMSFGVVAAVGGIAALVGMKKTWDPLPSVMSAGFTTVDIAPIKEGELLVAVWRGKPINILRMTADMPVVAEREFVVSGARYTINIGLCTHLGCIPEYKATDKKYKCACHGGEYDAAGIQTFGPPPRPFDIPPFKLNGTSIVIGEEGDDYKRMTAKA